MKERDVEERWEGEGREEKEGTHTHFLDTHLHKFAGHTNTNRTSFQTAK